MTTSVSPAPGSNARCQPAVAEQRPGALDGLRVVDAATLAAGPMVATALGEFGADVIKVEQPGAIADEGDD